MSSQESRGFSHERFNRNNGILGIFSKSEYSRTPTRELEIDTTCSICGHRGVIKYRSVKGTNSFVCMNCRQLYNREQRGDLPKEVESYNPITVMQ